MPPTSPASSMPRSPPNRTSSWWRWGRTTPSTGRVGVSSAPSSTTWSGGSFAVAPVVAAANVGNLGNIARVPPPLSTVLRARSQVMRSVIEDVVRSHERAVLIDVTAADDIFRDRRVFTPDLFHPGPVGHAAWADAALPGLRRAVELALSARADVLVPTAP